MDLLTFEPIYQTRVWGGRDLAQTLGRDLPGTDPIGEAWEIVDRPEAQSVHAPSNLTLAELIKSHGEFIFGPKHTTLDRFPILVKWLDCQERLSLQVHPPTDMAEHLGGEPKTECWFIAKAHPKASLFVGLKSTTEREAFESVLNDSGGAGLEPLLHRINVSDGESILLESGRLHAIDAGNLILEIQQNSDTTYRVYDWDRVGLDGQPRQLHIKESLASIDFEDFEPQTVKADTSPGERVIAEAKPFRIRQVNLAKGESLSIDACKETHIISVVSGQVQVTPHVGDFDEDTLPSPLRAQERVLEASSNVICPYVWGGSLHALDDALLLITDRFV